MSKRPLCTHLRPLVTLLYVTRMEKTVTKSVKSVDTTSSVRYRNTLSKYSGLDLHTGIPFWKSGLLSLEFKERWFIVTDKSVTKSLKCVKKDVLTGTGNVFQIIPVCILLPENSLTNSGISLNFEGIWFIVTDKCALKV
jgi:hypothetical protein